MDSIKEECGGKNGASAAADNSIFKGLGKNHDKSMRQIMCPQTSKAA